MPNYGDQLSESLPGGWGTFLPKTQLAFNLLKWLIF